MIPGDSFFHVLGYLIIAGQRMEEIRWDLAIQLEPVPQVGRKSAGSRTPEHLVLAYPCSWARRRRRFRTRVRSSRIRSVAKIPNNPGEVFRRKIPGLGSRVEISRSGVAANCF